LNETEAFDATRRLVDHVEPATSGWFERLAILPLARRLASMFIRYTGSHSVFEYATIALYFISIIVSMLGQNTSGLIVFAAASVTSLLAEFANRANERAGLRLIFLRRWRGAILVALVLALVWSWRFDDPGSASLILACWFTAQWSLAAYARQHGAPDPDWRSDTAFLALLLALSAATGQVFWGMALCLALQLAEQVWRQKQGAGA
jgi:hypothetical protein